MCICCVLLMSWNRLWLLVMMLFFIVSCVRCIFVLMVVLMVWLCVRRFLILLLSVVRCRILLWGWVGCLLGLLMRWVLRVFLVCRLVIGLLFWFCCCLFFCGLLMGWFGGMG